MCRFTAMVTTPTSTPTTTPTTPTTHHDVDDSAFRSVPTEEEQRATSPHAGHADDLANAAGADGVIPPELNDGLGQTGHVTPGAERPRYRSWIVPTGLVGIMWILSMIVFANVIFGGNEYEVTRLRVDLVGRLPRSRSASSSTR